VRRSASSGRTGSACAARHTPTLNTLVGRTRFTAPHQTRDKTVLSVSCLVCRCGRLLRTSSCCKFSVGDSLELSGIQFTQPRRTRHRRDRLAWRCDCELAFVVVKSRQINVKDGILPVTAFPLELLSYTLDLENFAMHGTSVVARCCQL